MPILIMALIALAVFGVIGILLFTASMLEVRTEEKHRHEHAVTAYHP
jgi:hypothetical protein